MGGLEFAQDESGNWGYKIEGADPVIPFHKTHIDSITLWSTSGSSNYGNAYLIFNVQYNKKITIGSISAFGLQYLSIYQIDDPNNFKGTGKQLYYTTDANQKNIEVDISKCQYIYINFTFWLGVSMNNSSSVNDVDIV